jgi:glutamate-1-semialdehyde 2,1-aminomutase
MHIGSMELTEADIQAIDRLQTFIPDQIFDAHAHLYDCSFAPNTAGPGSIFHQCGSVVTVKDYKWLQGRLYGGDRKIRLNIVSVPDESMADLSNGRRDASTRFLCSQLETYPDCVGEIFVLPDDKISDIEVQLIHPNIRGFKCYHSSAKSKPTWQADISTYLPESAWAAANEHGLCITLHMVKDYALSDPDNLDYIQKMCRKYPHAKLILAHCARGFAAWTVINGIRFLNGFGNIYFDVSAICESPAIYEVIKVAGTHRVLWGSDFPVSMIRGKCVSIADQFLWLNQNDSRKLGNSIGMNLVGIEGLLAFQQAAHLLQLTNKEVQDIFYYNAMELFQLAG